MLVRELMTSPAITCGPQVRLKEAAGLLAGHHVTALPVVDAHGRLVGVLSEADVIARGVPPDPRAHERPTGPGPGPQPGTPSTVGEAMTHFPLSVRSDADLAEAVELMTGTAVKSLPVLEDGRVVGVVSRADVVAALARSDDRVEAEVDELLRLAAVTDVEVEVREGVVLVAGLADPARQRMVRALVGTVAGVTGVRFAPSPR